jgi:hypothetical protein
MSCENRYQKGNDQYATPSWIKDKLFYGWFDPCPLNPKFLNDGLVVEWEPFTFVDPPYSNPSPWIDKAINESKLGKTIALLVKHDSSTIWWAKLHEAGAHFLPIMGRLHFNGVGPAPFPSILVILALNANQETKEE